MILSKHQFDYLLHEVLRDVETLRKAKAVYPEYVDDYVLKQIDDIKLFLNKIVGDKI